MFRTQKSELHGVIAGTPEDLIWATALGARIETRKRRSQGIDDELIRVQVISHYKQDFAEEDYGEFTQETLIGAVQRAVEEALSEDADWE
jgi:hypothetical protein